ncbi:MAG: hypothetical protein ABSD21_08375 [Rhizomicrobium sp.]
MTNHAILELISLHIESALLVLFVLASGFGAAFAAVYTYFKDVTSKYISLTNLYVLFTDRYNIKQMYDSLRMLTEYYKKNPATFLQRWKEDKVSPAGVGDLRAAKRVVDRYYYDIAQLYDARYISKSFASMLCAQAGLNVFYNICVPMSDVNFPKNEKNFYKILKRIRPKYGDGEIY